MIPDNEIICKTIYKQVKLEEILTERVCKEIMYWYTGSNEPASFELKTTIYMAINEELEHRNLKIYAEEKTDKRTNNKF